MRWDSAACLLSLSAAPSDPLLCKFADGGPKKRQNQGKFVQNGRAWPRNGDMVRGPLRDKNTNDIKMEWMGLPWQFSGWDLASTAGKAGSIPGQGTKILHAEWGCQGKKKKEWKFPWLDSWGRLESSSM